MRFIKRAVLFVLIIIAVLVVIGSQNKKESSKESSKEPSLVESSLAKTRPKAADCPSTFKVGYKILKISGGPKTAIWYPTLDAEKQYTYYGNYSSKVSRDGKLETGCRRFPLVVFSHGFFGCGIQSIFITEELARHGYIVAAPDHKDALCSIDGGAPTFSSANEPSLFDPTKWTEATYIDRKNDVQKVIDTLTRDSNFGKQISKVGLAGHSLGGYKALGLAGGCSSWKDSRIAAALLLSPYSLPFSFNKTLKSVRVPLMYQGADFDLGITPFIEGVSGAYSQSNAPKYFVKLRAGNHFIWTDLECSANNYKTIPDCLKSDTTAKLINQYAIAFLDKYLKGINSPLLKKSSTSLSTYQYSP